MTFADELKNQFLFEELTELYKEVLRRRPAEENWLLSQQAFRARWLSQLAGKDGATVI